MRIQLEMSEPRVDELKEFMIRVEIDTYKELFNNALSLLEWAVDQSAKGRKLVSIDEETGKQLELVMPALNRVRRRMPSACPTTPATRLAESDCDSSKGRQFGPVMI
mgnify:CR=1 FL=1